MSSSLWARLRGETAKTLLRTFVVKGVVSFGSLGLAVVIGQLYGPNGVGVYALAQSILLGAGLIARRGMDNALVRFIGRDFHSPQVRSYLYWAGLRSLVLSVPLMLFVYVVRAFAERFFAMPGLSEVLLGIGLAIPFYTWSFLLAGFFKAIRKPATAALQENGAISLIAGALLLSLVWFRQGEGPVLVWLGWVYFASAVFVAAQGHCAAMLWLRRQPGASEASADLSADEMAALRAVSQSFFVMSLAAIMQSVLSIMIAGKFLGPGELGLFKAAQQIGISVVFVLMVINAIFPARFAALYHQGDMETLGVLARRAAALGLVISAPFLAVCLLIPEWILGLFGQGFDSAAPLLRIVALAQLVNVATGSVGFLLNMTGHDRVMRNVALLCNTTALMGFLVLTPLFGALGAAFALAFVLVAQNLIALVLVWLKLGIWMMPGPNLLAFAGVKPQSDKLP